MIKAEEARRVANDSSVKIQQQLTVICKLIERTAKDSRFQADILNIPDHGEVGCAEL